MTGFVRKKLDGAGREGETKFQGIRGMGFWHTGYMEFHQPTGLEADYRPTKTVYRCQHCDAQFGAMEDLRGHRFEAHPYSRPVFFVRGIELGTSTFRVTRDAPAGDFVIERSTTASINGKSVRVADVPKMLAKVKNDKVKVELANDGANAVFEVAFRIAAVEDLEGVEAAFLKLAKKGLLTIASVEGFIEDCRPFTTADGYYDGICHYLYGVLAKERSPDSALPYEEYRTRFNRAADELLDYDRPIARIIRALVAFHFNHFADVVATAPAGRLRVASTRFAALLEGKRWGAASPPASRRNAMEDLLTDHETLRILRWATSPLAALGAEAADISALAKRDIPEFDRMKLRMLLAESSAASGDNDTARRVARALIGSPKTATWAERVIAGLADEKD